MLELNDTYTPLETGSYNIKSELTKELFDSLKVLKVDLQVFMVTSVLDHGKDTLVIVGGREVIYRRYLIDVKDLTKVRLSIDTSKGKRVTERNLLPFRYTDVVLNKEHVSKLLKYKHKDSITEFEVEELLSDDSIELNQNLENVEKAEKSFPNDGNMGSVKAAEHSAAFNIKVSLREELEDNIVYIYEAKPSTNSIALSKQFKIKHRHVIQDLFKLCQSKPSLLMGIEFQPYQYINGKDNVITYSTYLEVNEDVYYEFINKMGTPKSAEMVNYRECKVKEYFDAFKSLRDNMYIRGYKENEIKIALYNRTTQTSSLMRLIKDYTTHRNINSLKEDMISYDEMCIVIFNLINYSCGIDALEYDGSRIDRSTLSVELQNKILHKEIELRFAIKIAKNLDSPLSNLLALAFDRNKNILGEWLTEYGREDLWNKVIKKDKRDI